MINSLIIYGEYEKAITSLGLQNKYIEKKEELKEEKNDLNAEYDVFYSGYDDLKEKAMQMLLLNDEIQLIDSDVTYDYSKLKEICDIKTIDVSDEPLLLGRIPGDDITKEYAMYLKPLVVSYLTAQDNEIKKFTKYKLDGYEYYSDLFDAYIASKGKNSKQYMKSEKTKRYFQYRAKWISNKIYKGLRITSCMAEEFELNCVKMALGTIMYLLEKSIESDSVLLQNNYDITIANNIPNLNTISSSNNEGYQILRISYENAIGKLPVIGSLDELARLKDKKHKEIKRLQAVIGETEKRLTSEGSEKAIKQAENDIKKAANDLNKNIKSAKISKYATYISVPLSLSCFEKLGNFSRLISVIGGVTTFQYEESKKKNDWINLIF